MENKKREIKAIVGLGNPGSKFYNTRHNIGFRVVDLLVETAGSRLVVKDEMEYAKVNICDKSLVIVKPQTFMNVSGKVIPFLKKMGIDVANIIVVHDELELPFGNLKFKEGGSAKGHNGLRSIISIGGDDFLRLRFGIGRPDDKANVSDYVLKNFSEPVSVIEEAINEAVKMIEAQICF